MGAWLDPHGHKFHSHVKQRGKKIEYELSIIDRFVIHSDIVFLNAIRSSYAVARIGVEKPMQSRETTSTTVAFQSGVQ